MPLGAYRIGSFAAAGPTRTPWTLVTSQSGTTTLPPTSTTQPRWGTTSIDCSTGTRAISFSKSGFSATSSVNAGGLIPIGLNDNFTVELWMYIPTANMNTQYGLFDAGPGGVAIGIHPQNRIYLGFSNVTYGLISGQQFSANTWNHFAFMRSGSTVYTFINGAVSSDSTTRNWSFTNPWNSNIMPSIGRGPGTNALRGFIVDFRVSAGAIYPTTGLTVPTGPLTNLASTQLLIPGYDGTLQDDPTK